MAIPPRLQTARLIIRPLAAEDREAYIRARTDSAEHWRPWVPAAEPGKSWGDLFDEGLRRNSEGLANGTSCRLAAFDNADGRTLVGFASINNVVRGAFMCGDLGWSIVKAREGRGLACEMVARVIDHAFTSEGSGGLGLHRLQANVIPRNARSMRLAERLGLRREGLALRMIQINGAWEDHAMFAVLADEWPAAGAPGRPASSAG